MIAQFIPDIIAQVVASANTVLSNRLDDPFEVYYDFGHEFEIIKNLVAKDGAPSLKDKKYPLVWLVMDFEEEILPKSHIYSSVALQMIICVPSSQNYTMQERRDKSFLPRLYPIYEELINQLCESKLFVGHPVKEIPHIKIDRPFWSGPDKKGEANPLQDIVDAIQIKNLNLKIKTTKECTTPTFKT
jgi:hypothetical protein